MKNNESLFIAVWTAEIQKLLKNVHELLEKIGFDTIDMPHNVFENDKPVSLVFAGQYSAGKSTILKALTGLNNITVGEGITTQEAHSYDWNGIKVIDTPGIHTTLRPDHDEISYQAIADADMLVYVVTQELFDDFIGQNFRKLLIEKDKADEMILIVNKMADIGNTPENQEIKLMDLKKVTTPYTPAQLRTVFVDAESYLDSLSEPDEEIAEELRVRSNYNTLISTLNTFVRDKEISSRMTTILYQLFEILQKALIKYQPSTGDNDIDAIEEHLFQERSIISQTQLRIETAVKSICSDTASQIRKKGSEIAEEIYKYDNELDAHAAISATCEEVHSIISDSADKVTQQIKDLSEDCKVQLDEFLKSDFSNTLRFHLESKIEKGNSLIEHILKSDFLAQSGKKIIDNTIGTNTVANGLKIFSESNVHNMVLNVGHFFGHNFKPWEAVKWTKGINVAGKTLGILGVVFSLGMQVKDEIDADKHRQEMRSNREKLRAYFNMSANEVIKYFNNTLSDFLEKYCVNRINEIDSQISEIRNMRLKKSETYKLLENAQNSCKLLISNIHQNSW